MLDARRRALDKAEETARQSRDAPDAARAAPEIAEDRWRAKSGARLKALSRTGT